MKRKRLLLLLALLMTAATGAWAEESETINTATSGKTVYTGTHFKITASFGCDGDGIILHDADDHLGTATIEALNGENITKIEMHLTSGGMLATYTTTTAGKLVATNSGSSANDISVTDINATSVTIGTTAGDGDGWIQINKFVIYYGPAPATYTVTLDDGGKDTQNWTITPAEATTTGVTEGKNVSLTYSGRLKVKSVTATTDAKPVWDGDLSKLTAQSTAEFATATNGMTIKGTLGANVKVSIAAGATVTLDGVTINGVNNISYNWAGLNCLGNAIIILKDDTENKVRGFIEDYPGIHVPAGSKLTIQGGTEGTGKLTASPFDGGTDESYGAGIGGGYQIACGDISIEGGIITATGGDYAAGIGGGKATCGNISITGGTVTATGRYGSPGIGSGYSDDASCGNITIASTVKKVTATKGEGAPYSIGKGDGDDGTCGTVTIGGTKYWENNAAVDNDAETYLAQATIEYPAPAKTPATVTKAPTGAAIVGVGKTTALVSGGVADGGTLRYAVTTTNTKPTSTDGFSATVPTAQTITASGKVYVWYFVKADDTHTDSEIAATAIEVPVADIVWDITNVSDLYADGYGESYEKEGVTLSANAQGIYAVWSESGNPEVDGISFDIFNAYGGYTFTAPTGKKFTKIEMTLIGQGGWNMASLGTGWAYGEDHMYKIYKVTWTGTAASTVGLLTGTDDFSGTNAKSIAFYLSE